MRVLVTGASGFIGRHLCVRLVSENYALTCASRIKVDIPEIDAADVRHFTYEGLESNADWRTALEGIDAVVHLAACVHIDPNKSGEQIFDAVNVHGTRRLAQQAVAAGVQRFIYMSTVKVYGEANELGPAGAVVPFHEQTKVAPEDAYARSKYAAENALLEIAASSSLQVLILRPPLVYGPRVGANFLRLMRLVDSALALPFAAIKNSRSLIFVDNLVDAVLACMRVETKPVNHVYLVSDAEVRSTPALVEDLGVALNRSVRLFSVPPAVLQSMALIAGQKSAAMRLLGSLVVDTSLITTELGWRPPYSMTNGLARTARWYRGSNE